MNLQELIDEWNVETEAIILEPQEIFNTGIIGVSEDKHHLIYSYQKLVKGMASESFSNKTENDERTFDDCLDEACEWVDYNTLRALPYMNQDYAPIIIYEFI